MNYVATIGWFNDGSLSELFLNTSGKAGSEADSNAADGATSISLALQYGCPAEVIRHALKRNADGSATGPLAKALDVVSKMRP